MPKRFQRINELIKEELAKILLKEVDFPKEVLVTITRVETSFNLKEAQVFISVWPEIKAIEVLKILNRQIYDLQQKINQRLKMKIVPKIKFKEEVKTKTAARIEEILAKIEKNRER